MYRIPSAVIITIRASVEWEHRRVLKEAIYLAIAKRKGLTREVFAPEILHLAGDRNGSLHFGRGLASYSFLESYTNTPEEKATNSLD